MRVFIFCFFLLFSGSVIGQNTVNKTDAQGKKQGYWIKRDARGNMLYQATFKDDKPVGEMKRFHPNGKVKAIIAFIEGSDESDAQLFDERGKLIARGKYLGQNKTGEWTYLNDSKIVSTENYFNGQKNGISKRYFPTGELLEESNWQNDQLNGLYRTYFQNGKTYLECNYSEGKRNGKFHTWFPDGTMELDASYNNNERDKNWNYFDEKGFHIYTLKYDLGKLLNPEVQDSIDKEKNENYKTKADNIPDPEKFMQNPDEYLRLLQNH